MLNYEDAYNNGYAKGFQEGEESTKEYILLEIREVCNSMNKSEILKELEELCYVE